MRKLAVAMALATTALAGPAFARDGAWYVGIEGGAMLVEDLDYDLSPTGNTDDDDDSGQIGDALSVDHMTGWDVDALVGYDFGPARVEFEVGWRQAELDEVQFNALTPIISPFTGQQGAERAGTRYTGANGFTRVLSFMLNGMIDIGSDESAFSGFAGGGVGVARTEAWGQRAYNQAFDFADDSDTGFAWQAIAGVRTALNQNVDVGLKYRFFNAPEVEFQTTTGQGIETRFRSHSLLLSLIYNFGAPTPPPPPPPPPPPAPPPPPPPPPEPAPVVQPPGPFLVFFDWDQSNITPEAAQVLDRAIEQYQQTGQTSVQLAGHADKSGPNDYNMALSERRAQSVRDYMVGRGIPDGVIATQAFGEERPLVETADGVREPQNRRVEINYGPGPGYQPAGPTPAGDPTTMSDPAMSGSTGMVSDSSMMSDPSATGTSMTTTTGAGTMDMTTTGTTTTDMTTPTTDMTTTTTDPQQ